MIPLYSKQEFDSAKSTDKLTCMCEVCDEHFKTTKKMIKYVSNHNLNHLRYCSKRCKAFHEQKQGELICTHCQTLFHKKAKEIRKSKSGNHFCSKSCSTTYNNKNKKYGTRRSKLEVWLEEQLTLLYPNLSIDFNQSNAIGSELDIYIPSLNLAFELNGIFHYEPIYGKDKLGKIQENDMSKSKVCIDNKIDLCVIDTSGQKYFKPLTSQKYLDIIINIIKERL